MRKALFLLLSLWIPAASNAQSHYLEIPRYEAGLQFDFNSLGGVGDGGGGFGGRFHYNFDEHFALDSEVIFRQQTVSAPPGTNIGTGTIGQTTGLFGIRAGEHLENVGVFARARAGFLHFGSDNGVTLLSRNTFPAFDVGMTLERYSGPTIWRLEWGEMIVPFGNATASPNPFNVTPQPPQHLGTRISPSLGFGIAFRF